MRKVEPISPSNKIQEDKFNKSTFNDKDKDKFEKFLGEAIRKRIDKSKNRKNEILKQ